MLGHRRGPVGAAPDAVLVGHIRQVLDVSPFHGEGYRKAWAKLRVAGIRTSKERVRRLMREHDLHEPPAGGLEVRGHEPPLSVEPRHAQGGVHPDGLELRVEADTAIAPALGDRERRVPARRPTGGRWDVLGARADLLDADNIGAGPVHKIHEPVPDTRANPVRCV